jgi:hypothetical protein
MRNLPAHAQHQEKTKQQKTQRGQTVLDADDLVVGGENIFLQEPRLVVMMGFVRSRVRVWMCGCLHDLLNCCSN